MAKRLKITQTGSTIARPGNQEKILLGMGLGKIGRTRSLEDTDAVRGMITKVSHLVSVEEEK